MTRIQWLVSPIRIITAVEACTNDYEAQWSFDYLYGHSHQQEVSGGTVTTTARVIDGVDRVVGTEFFG